MYTPKPANLNQLEANIRWEILRIPLMMITKATRNSVYEQRQNIQFETQKVGEIRVGLPGNYWLLYNFFSFNL